MTNLLNVIINEITDKGLAYLGAGIAMIAGLGVGGGQAYIGGKAAEAIAKNPESESKVRIMLIISAAISESSAIYSLIIAILLIFVAK